MLSTVDRRREEIEGERSDEEEEREREREGEREDVPVSIPCVCEQTRHHARLARREKGRNAPAKRE